jgi:PPOX class probable F420-dependent enzyme
MTNPPDDPLTAEVEAFLRAHTRTFLFTLRRDGSPTVHPMTGIYRDGALWFNTYRKSAKARNLERDGRAACLVTSGVTETPFRALLLEGRAEIMPIGTEWPGLRERVAGAPTPIPGTGSDAARRTQERIRSGKRIVARMVPSAARFV